MGVYLGDDGTLDTVICCSGCGQEWRFNFDPCPDEEEGTEYSYDAFVEECIAEVKNEHRYANLLNHKRTDSDED